MCLQVSYLLSGPSPAADEREVLTEEEDLSDEKVFTYLFLLIYPFCGIGRQ